MARTKVAISRKAFEDWLFELCPVFTFQSRWGNEGVFVCPLSDSVAIVVTMRGHMKLATRKTGRLLKLSSGVETRRHNHATKRWKENWAYSFHVLFNRYKENRDELNRKAKRVANLPRRSKATLLSLRNRKALTTALDKLEVAATIAGDQKTVEFCGGDIRFAVQNKLLPKSRQLKKLREKLEEYKIYVPSAAAA